MKTDSPKPCYRCKSTKKVAQRHKVAFHIMLWSGLLLTMVFVGVLLTMVFVGVLLLLGLFLVPKKIYCVECGAQLGDATTENQPNNYEQGKAEARSPGDTGVEAERQ